MNMNDVTKRTPTLLAAVHNAPPGGLLDSELATKVGIADRDILRSILAVMAVDGQITAVDLSDGETPYDEHLGWVDGEAPLIIRLAPKDAPTLESRVVEALLDAGTDGLEEDTLHDVIVESLATDVPCDLTEHIPDGYLQPTLDALALDGVIRSVGCNHYALTAAEWARRLKVMVDIEGTELSAAAIERLLAGTDPQ